MYIREKHGGSDSLSFGSREPQGEVRRDTFVLTIDEFTFNNLLPSLVIHGKCLEPIFHPEAQVGFGEQVSHECNLMVSQPPSSDAHDKEILKNAKTATRFDRKRLNRLQARGKRQPQPKPLQVVKRINPIAS